MKRFGELVVALFVKRAAVSMKANDAPIPHKPIQSAK
jgi:hypothetical protein